MASVRSEDQDDIIPIAHREIVTIPIWIRDTYARVHSQPIYQLEGPLSEGILTEEAAEQSLTSSSSDLFLSGADVFSYLRRNMSNNCDSTITIVIHSLRDLYWNVRQLLPQSEVDLLYVAMSQPLPKFKNIFDYNGLQKYRDRYPIPLYQLFGTITPFSVIHIPVSHFVDAMNAKQPLQIMLAGTGIVIQLAYEEYDFWDPETQSLIESIPVC